MNIAKPIKLVIIGRVNKGKSSLVATLGQNDDIDIAPTPGTTSKSQSYSLHFQKRLLCELIDTPGFEQADQVLSMLTKDNPSASDRPKTVQQVTDSTGFSHNFPEEFELLNASFTTDAIVYVVDAAHPFKRNYESEMEIIRWCGKPTIAIMNSIGEPAYESEWRSVLQQYFSQVISFDAISSHPLQRLNFFKAVGSVLHERKHETDEIIKLIELRDQHKREESIKKIMHYLRQLCEIEICEEFREDFENNDQPIKMKEQLKIKVTQTERHFQNEIAHLLGFQRLKTSIEDLHKLIDSDNLFHEQTWKVLGLNRTQLTARGAILGAATGAILDLKLLGMTHFAGSIIGAIGGAGAALVTSNSKPDKKFAGIQLAGEQMICKIDLKSNMIWVLFDRIFSYTKILLQRAHANPNTLILEKDLACSTNMTSSQQNILTKFYKRSRSKKSKPEQDHLCFEMLLELIQKQS